MHKDGTILFFMAIPGMKEAARRQVAQQNASSPPLLGLNSPKVDVSTDSENSSIL
jgi:hypothetical protein